jgi:hypothetical protein
LRLPELSQHLQIPAGDGRQTNQVLPLRHVFPHSRPGRKTALEVAGVDGDSPTTDMDLSDERPAPTFLSYSEAPPPVQRLLPTAAEFSCLECGARFEVADDLAGKVIRCRECHSFGKVPDRDPKATSRSLRRNSAFLEKRNFSMLLGALAVLVVLAVGGAVLHWLFPLRPPKSAPAAVADQPLPPQVLPQGASAQQQQRPHPVFVAPPPQPGRARPQPWAPAPVPVSARPVVDRPPQWFDEARTEWTQALAKRAPAEPLPKPATWTELEYKLALQQIQI